MTVEFTNEDQAKNWLRQFGAAVRAKDYAAGRALCNREIVSFGTVVLEAEGLDKLVKEQWEMIWENSADFEFAMDSVRVWGGNSGSHLMVATRWHSVGIRSCGERFERAGRCTLMLVKEGAHWLAVHTHFSAVPVADLSGNF